VLTVNQVRVLDLDLNMMFRFSSERDWQCEWVDIAEFWGNRQIKPNASLSASVCLFDTLNQNNLFAALKETYKDRVRHYRFKSIKNRIKLNKAMAQFSVESNHGTSYGIRHGGE